MLLKQKLQHLKQNKEKFRDLYGVSDMALFGSYARDEASEDSDIDIAILKIEKKSFFKRLKAKEFLEKYLNKKVDISERNRQTELAL